MVKLSAGFKRQASIDRIHRINGIESVDLGLIIRDWRKVQAGILSILLILSDTSQRGRVEP
jgi:hypothetical protein